MRALLLHACMPWAVSKAPHTLWVVLCVLWAARLLC